MLILTFTLGTLFCFTLGTLFCFIIAWIIIKVDEYMIDKRYSAVVDTLIERYDFCVSHNKNYNTIFEEE